MVFKWVMLCRIVQVSRVSIGIRKWKILFMLNSRRRRMKRWTKHLEDLKRRIFRSLDCIKKPKNLIGYTFSYKLFSFVRIEVFTWRELKYLYSILTNVFNMVKCPTNKFWEVSLGGISKLWKIIKSEFWKLTYGHYFYHNF